MIHIITVEPRADNTWNIVERTESGPVKVCESVSMLDHGLDEVAAKAHEWAKLYGADICLFQGIDAIACARGNHRQCGGGPVL